VEKLHLFFELAGEDVLWVSHMLGHASPEMTLKKYARFIRNDKVKRATFLTDAIEV
jgi:hypothetical protein